MYTNDLKRAVGLFSKRQDAESALQRLRDNSFDMDRVSVVAKNANTDNVAGKSVEQNKGEQVRGSAGAGAVAGATTGGLMGLIGSLGVLAIPGVGPIAEVGIVLANTLLGSGIGAAGGGLAGALIGWGVPKEQADYYDTRLNQQGHYLILVEGSEQDIRVAEQTLGQYGIQDWNTFTAPRTGDRI